MARPENKPRTATERRLRQLMADAGIKTYKELAEKAGVSESTIQYFAAQSKSPKLDTIYKLAQALGVKMSRLIME